MSTPFSIYEPFPQFHGRDGQPLEAGQIFIGQPNMDTIANPVQVYWDAALTIPAVQPIRTTAGYPWHNGSPSNFYIDGDDYSVKILDRQNALVFSSPSCAERFPVTLLSGGGIPAGDIAFTATGFGATATNLDSKLATDLVSVFDFLTNLQRADVASFSGLLNVTDAINNAIAVGGTNGRDVYFPPGKYRVQNSGATPAINVSKSGVSLRGAGRGATIVYNVGTDAAIGVAGTNVIPLEGVRVSDMTIQGTGAGTHGLYVEYTKHSSFERIESKSNGKDGFRTAFTQSVSFTDCDPHGNTENGIVLGDTSLETVVRGGDIHDNTLAGAFVSLDGGTGRPFGARFEGVSFRANGAAAQVLSADACSFVGCTFQQDAGLQLLISRDNVAADADAALVDGCSFSGTAAVDATINHATNATIINSRFVNPVIIMAGSSNARLINNVGAAVTDGGLYTVQLVLDSALLRVATSQIANAFRLRTIVAGGTYPILEMHGWRLWIDDSTKILRIKSTDPTAPGDGEPVNLYSGMPTVYTVGTVGLPGSLPDANTMKGQVARITDGVAALAWGATISAPLVAGITPYLIWSNGTNWTVVGK